MADKQRDIPTRAAVRSARLAALPIGFAGRAAAGWGRKVVGGDREEITAAVLERNAEHMFAVLGELKGGAMKLGQALSVYEAMIPAELAEPYRMTLQAVYKHLRVLEDAGLVSRPRGPQPRPVRLQVQVFDLMDAWIERHRVRAEQRYRRLDAVLAQMKGEKHDTGSPKRSSDPAEDHRGGHRGRSGPAGHPDDS